MLDFYAIDSLLTAEQRAIRGAVREFVDGEIIPNVRGWWDNHEFPLAIKDQYGALGLFEYGCAGVDNISYGLINYELERGDSGLRSFASVQGAISAELQLVIDQPVRDVVHPGTAVLLRQIGPRKARAHRTGL